MPYDKNLHKRAPNGFRMLENPWDLTEGADRLLLLVAEFQDRSFLSTKQLGYLMGVPQRKVRGYLKELVEKKRIAKYPENGKSQGRYKTNQYRVLDFDFNDWLNS